MKSSVFGMSSNKGSMQSALIYHFQRIPDETERSHSFTNRKKKHLILGGSNAKAGGSGRAVKESGLTGAMSVSGTKINKSS